MAGGGDEGGGHTKARELDQTPTWAVAAVCAVIILISIILEKVLHMFGQVCICFHPLHFISSSSSSCCYFHLKMHFDFALFVGLMFFINGGCGVC